MLIFKNCLIYFQNLSCCHCVICIDNYGYCFLISFSMGRHDNSWWVICYKLHKSSVLIHRFSDANVKKSWISVCIYETFTLMLRINTEVQNDKKAKMFDTFIWWMHDSHKTVFSNLFHTWSNWRFNSDYNFMRCLLL